MARLSLGTVLLAAAVATTVGFAMPTSDDEKRGEEIPHNKVEPLAENPGDGEDGKLVMKYKPFLEVVDGCLPYPAVDAQGQTKAGLKPSGLMGGDCGRSVGQVYARVGSVRNRVAVMYAWYFPKDQNVDDRNDWEEIVVFVGLESNTPLVGISYSGHGGYPDKYTKARLDGLGYRDGVRPKVQYSRPELTTHRVSPTTKKGNTQPVINYNKLTEAARVGLRETNWNAAVCPFCDDKKFQEKLDKAWSDNYA